MFTVAVVLMEPPRVERDVSACETFHEEPRKTSALLMVVPPSSPILSCSLKRRRGGW